MHAHSHPLPQADADAAAVFREAEATALRHNTNVYHDRFDYRQLQVESLRRTGHL